MFRRKLRPNTDPRAGELRAMFVANRDRVQSWPTNWDFPEVAWPAPRALHASILVATRAPAAHHQHQPGRLLLVVPESHEFDRLTMNTRTVADPAYLAERLTPGVDAANLKGWHADDAQTIYRWMHEAPT